MKGFSVLFVLFLLSLVPLFFDNAFATDYNKYVTAEDLGILQLAAHDLFNVDRCDHKTRSCAVEFENGKLDLTTLFVNTTNSYSEFDDSIIALGGEHRNRENIMLFTVASNLGEQYVELSKIHDKLEAKNMIVQLYHEKLAQTYKKVFDEDFPTMSSENSSDEELLQQNLALRTIHDFLPGKVKVDDRWYSTLDPSLYGLVLDDDKEIYQKSSKLDGKFDKEFLDIHVCLDPPDCNFVIIVDLLEADRSFGDQFGTTESFDDFLEQLEDGHYDKQDSVLEYIRVLMARGLNFTQYS